MARIPRNQLKGPFYHTIQRGVNRQIIFEEYQDYQFFMKLLWKYSKESNIGICAYCLMNNHYHILLHDKEDKLSTFMRKLNGTYASYFNKKYERFGYLFQGRFVGKPVNNIAYFKHLLWYILRNPEKDKICEAQNFKWSSYKETYENSKTIDRSLIDILFRDQNDFYQFITAKEEPLSEKEREEIEFHDSKKLKENKRRRENLKRTVGTDDPTIIQHLCQEERDEIIIKLREEGFSIREIERNTGISRGIIYKKTKKNL